MIIVILKSSSSIALSLSFVSQVHAAGVNFPDVSVACIQRGWLMDSCKACWGHSDQDGHSHSGDEYVTPSLKICINWSCTSFNGPCLHTKSMIKPTGSANFAEIQAVGWAKPWGNGRGPGYCLRHHRVTFPWVQEQETEGESLNHKFWNGFQFSLLLPPGEHQHSDEDGAEAGNGVNPQAHRGG